jgi:hypothetical protein
MANSSLLSETLTHNPRNAVTHSITRVERDGGSCVVKVLNGRNEADTAPEWRASLIAQNWPSELREGLQFLYAHREAFFGDGTIAEDVGNFIPDAIFDGFFSAEQFNELEPRLFGGYLRGLSEGFDVATDVAQQCLWASAVKYVWLGPLLLDRASQNEHHLYGGGVLDDANAQFRHRGITLLRLCEWANKALNM